MANAHALARHPAPDPRHVSASLDKERLRQIVMRDPLMSQLIAGLRGILGYGAGSIAAREPLRSGLCAQPCGGFSPPPLWLCWRLVVRMLPVHCGLFVPSHSAAALMLLMRVVKSFVCQSPSNGLRISVWQKFWVPKIGV